MFCRLHSCYKGRRGWRKGCWGLLLSPRDTVMGSIWCFNRGNFKQNGDGTGQEQSTWILSGRSSILKSILHPFSTITFPVAPFTFFSYSVAAIRWLIHFKGPLTIYSVAPEDPPEVTYEKYAQCHSSLCFVYDWVTAFTSPCPWAAFRGPWHKFLSLLHKGAGHSSHHLGRQSSSIPKQLPFFLRPAVRLPHIQKKKKKFNWYQVWKAQLLDAVKVPTGLCFYKIQVNLFL